MSWTLPFFEWCDETFLAVLMRRSTLAFPIVETFHLFALTVLFGAIVVVNLRLCGLMMKDRTVPQVSRQFAPWILVSLVTMLSSGVLLFLAEALRCYSSDPFWFKMAFLLAAIVFHYTIHRKVATSETHHSPITTIPVAMFSLILWISIGLAGRAIAFI
jgi:hypothetical protein